MKTEVSNECLISEYFFGKEVEFIDEIRNSLDEEHKYATISIREVGRDDIKIYFVSTIEY